MKFGHKQLYIDGKLCDAADGKTFDVICPGDESIVATIAWAGRADTERALVSAQKGFENWSALPQATRLEWMDKLRTKILERRDHLRHAISHEMGKVWAGTDEDLTSITDSLKYYADEIRKRGDVEIEDREGTHKHRIVSQPLGVAVAFLAYNFPLLNLGFKLGPALAAGCSIIIKPSEFSPLSAYIIGELCHEIGFPAGVVTVLCGDVQEVGIPLCESKIPRLITMIGSTETAQALIRQSSATSLKRFSMECGGNAPFVVLEDADLEAAISLGAGLKTGNSGQICVAPNRFLVHESVIDEFTEGMRQKFAATKLGFGEAEQPDMGPLTNRGSVDKVNGIVQQARAQGAKLVFGGKALDRAGYYYEPTILRLDDAHAPVLQREIFGPVAIIVPFATRGEALAIANDTDGGLASYVFTTNPDAMAFFADKLEFGEVQINGVKYDIYLPHGGIKNSGFGVDCSELALDDYLIRKRVSRAISQGV
ncbi:aldehyde dehydrogenase family protein [Neolewinella aurantiaca]|uniref:Aldehyde dehydrogenase family protein n=1 Tax=Neolewinella aurantiaca TaxID=2602767 RepID=A0A5C7FPV0_9BACT|nr:aldehyde dehydrogenase family protein [Neolewinella aurantiaca]TXF87972.1 aldehyde dehydrogenase family protein [Neolewinella aurantiaca]